MAASRHAGYNAWLCQVNRLKRDVYRWRAGLEKSKNEKEELTATSEKLTNGRFEGEGDRRDRWDNWWLDQSDWISRKQQLKQDVYASGGLLPRLQAEERRESLDGRQKAYVQEIRVLIDNGLANLTEPMSEAAVGHGNSLAYRSVGG